MAARAVTHVRKDIYGNITAIGNPGMTWSPRLKADAIYDIEHGLNTYHVSWPEKVTQIRVVPATSTTGKYLRTDRDSTTRNNLDDLPTGI